MIKRKLNPEQGKRLNECLKKRRLTQKELAEKSGYTPQYISNIIVGKKNMSEDSAKVFSKILNVRKEYLLCDDNFMTTTEFINSEYAFWDARDTSIMNILKLIGVSTGLVFFSPELDIETIKECKVKGSFDRPCSFLLEDAAGQEHSAILESISITFEEKQSTISVGQYLAFCDHIYNYIGFALQQLVEQNDGTYKAIDLATQAAIRESRALEGRLSEIKESFNVK